MQALLRGVLVTVAALAGCAAPSGDVEHLGATAQAITGGESDDDDPAVVALLVGGQAYCTGALVAKGVVATASHCVLPTPPDAVYFGARPGTGGKTIEVAHTHAHPDFDPATLVNDIAIVVLRNAPDVEPLPLYRGELGEDDVGRSIRLVGFGATTAASNGAPRKRSGTTTIGQVKPGEFRFNGQPSQTCTGDSGGPALIEVDGDEMIVGITSSGDTNCERFGRDVPVDAYRDFLLTSARAYSGLPSSGTSVPSGGCSTAVAGGGDSTKTMLVALFFVGVLALARRRDPPRL